MVRNSGDSAQLLDQIHGEGNIRPNYIIHQLICGKSARNVERLVPLLGVLMDDLVHGQYEIHHEKTAILLLYYQVLPAVVDDLASKGGIGQNLTVLEYAEICGSVRRGLDEESVRVAEY